MMESIEVRAADPQDARAISQLFLDRYDDITPGAQSWKPARKRYLDKHGEGYFADKIERSMVFPTENFAYVATFEDDLVGYASAIADSSNQTFARLVGLVIDRQCENKGVGTSLEIQRQGWADANDRILYGQIVDEHTAARSFYKRNGYKEVGTRVMAETVFRLIEHTPPTVQPVTLEIPWADRLGDEPLVY